MKMTNMFFKENLKLRVFAVIVLMLSFVACNSESGTHVSNVAEASDSASSLDTAIFVDYYDPLFYGNSCDYNRVGEVAFVSSLNATFQCKYDHFSYYWLFLDGPAGCYTRLCSVDQSGFRKDVKTHNCGENYTSGHLLCFVVEQNALYIKDDYRSSPEVIRGNVYKNYEELVQNFSCADDLLGLEIPIAGIKYLCVKSLADGNLKWIPSDEADFFKYDWGSTSSYFRKNYEDSLECENLWIADSIRHASLLKGHGTMTDNRDGQVYKTVTIGTQTWMAENLNYRYIKPKGKLDSSSFCYNNDPAYCSQYGRFYLDEEGICPDGWRMPVKADWDTLIQLTSWSEDYESTSLDCYYRNRKRPPAAKWNNLFYDKYDEFGFSILLTGTVNTVYFYEIGLNSYRTINDTVWYTGIGKMTYFHHFDPSSYPDSSGLHRPRAYSVRCIAGDPPVPESSSSYASSSSSSVKASNPSIRVGVCGAARWCADQDGVECVKKRSTICVSDRDLLRTVVLEPCGCW